jgi:transcriptional regulator with XRE-family HTH domain
MAGISNPYLSQIERGLRKPSAEILRQIASALQISAETLYVRAGILDEPGGPTDLVAEIRRVADLDEDQKRALVQIYETFRREAAAKAEGAVTGVDGPEPAPLDVSDGISDEDEESAGAARR